MGLKGWLLVGPAGSGSRWHFDPWGTAAWNLLFEGRKLWAFQAPGTAPPLVSAQLLGGLGEVRRFYEAPEVRSLAEVIRRGGVSMGVIRLDYTVGYRDIEWMCHGVDLSFVDMNG